MGAAKPERGVDRHRDLLAVRGEQSTGSPGEAFSEATEVEIAWAAGLFEGEGCISIIRRRDHPYPRLEVASNDRDVLEHFQKVIGLGNVRVCRKANEKHAEQLRWTLYSRPLITDAFLAMYPFLGERRRARGTEILAQTNPEQR